MCQSKVVLWDKEGIKEIMEEAAQITTKGEDVVVVDLLGKTKKIQECEIHEVNLMKHTVILKKK